MKHLRSILLITAFITLATMLGCVTAKAQTNAGIFGFPTLGTPTNVISNPPTVQSSIQGLVDALAGGLTNAYGGAYGLYAPSLAKRFGGGVGLFYPVSQYVVAGVRVDYLNGGFWMPSGNATLQLPLHAPIFTNVVFTPFAYAGVGVPIAGAKDNNGNATGILGAGVYVNLWQSTTPGTHWYSIDSVKLVGDVEKWGGFAGNQYRLGIFINKKF